MLNHFVGAVVAKSAHIATLVTHNMVEECEFGVAAVHDVQVIFFDRTLSNRSFVVAATAVGCHINSRWDVAIHFEVRVQSRLYQAAAFGLLQDGGLNQAGKCRDDRAINQRDGLVDLAEPGVTANSCGLLSQFLNDLFEKAGIEESRRLAE